MRLSAELVKSSFVRLRQNIVEGKSGVERTSALMYFLAYDAAYKNQQPMSLDPNTITGKENREVLSREYCRLVTVRVIGPQKIWSVVNLGLVERSGIDPVKRISSNFLTVPLKKASQREIPVPYPQRPRPLLNIGYSQVIGNWGVVPHLDWEKNIPIFLAERTTRWPFTDLAMFVLRDSEFIQQPNFLETVKELLSNRFSPQLATYWFKQIQIEFNYKPFKVPESWSLSDYHNAFEDEEWVSSISNKDTSPAISDNTEHLEERILYLEDILKTHNISFKKD